MNKNEMEGTIILIVNHKYFVPPQDNSDLKQIFNHLMSVGAGRPIDNNGLVDGPWTPELLCQEISKYNPSGVELRTVQHWFQIDNDRGISTDNIRYLAKIFGCDDPEYSSEWQSKLIMAKKRLTSERREKRISDNNIQKTQELLKTKTKTFPEKIEWIFSLPESINLIIVSWLVFCGLGLMNFVLGTLTVTYPISGLDKQVGFIWSPSLTILPIIVIPLYIYFVSDLVSYWKRFGRLACVSNEVMSVRLHHDHDVAWYTKVNNFSFSFWAITLFCLFFVFGVQWGGIYLPSYVSGDAYGVQIDRYLISLVQPNIITIAESVFLSVIGYLYTASYIAFLMFGLLFVVIVSFDYVDVFAVSDLENSLIDGSQIYEAGKKIIWGNFRIVVVGLWFAILIKLQISYLASDSPNFIKWLITDFISTFIDNAAQNGWLHNTTISHFTTFLLMLVTVFTFAFSVVKIRSVFERLSINRNDKQMVHMFIVVGILGLNLIVIGLPGFTYLLMISVIASFHVLSGLRLQKF